MISSTLQDVRKGKKAARRAAQRRTSLLKEGEALSKNSMSTDSISSESVCGESIFNDESCSNGDDSMSVVSQDSHGESILRLQEKAQELLREIQGSLKSYADKEQQVTKAITFHMDRAKGRYDSRNMMGATLSMKKVKQLQREYQHVNDALQFFSFRNLELDRFCREIQKQLDDLSVEKDCSKDYAALEQQALHICSSLGDIKTVLEEPDIDIKIPDQDLLKELAKIVKAKGGDDDDDSEDDDDYEESTSTYDSDEDDDFSLSGEDADLVRDLMLLTASS